MRFIRWWQYGILGGVVLSLATLVNAIRAVIGGAGREAEWTVSLGFAAAIFGMGFVCGVVVWAGQGLSRKLGLFGDAILGMVVMLVFFTARMLLFDPALLGRNWSSGGLPMFALGAMLGLIGAAWLGRDLRKEAANRTSDHRKVRLTCVRQ